MNQPVKPQPQSIVTTWLTNHYAIEARGSSIMREITAGLTTFIAMVYTVIVIPNMLAGAGFEAGSVFIATCLVAAFGSILMGVWANLPLAIGCAISLTAFTTYSLVIGQNVSVEVALGAVFIMGIVFTLITLLGIRQKILESLPKGIAQGTGAGIGLFLLLIAAKSVGLVVQNPNQGLPISLGDITSFPVMMSVIGLGIVIGLERRKIPGSILMTILAIAFVGLLFDDQVNYVGIFAIPSFSAEDTLLFDFDIIGALNIAVLPVILALVMTSVFDTTLTIRAVAAQADLLDRNGQIINSKKALSSDSVSSVIAGLVGGTPASVYIESAAGVAAGGKTGLTATIVGLLFLATLFFAPIVYLVPAYATAPALMYVGLLMLQNIRHLNFDDPIDAFSGLICTTFIVLSGNIVTGIMLGFVSLVIARICAGEFRQLNVGTLVITVILATFYFGGWAL